jgi:hypothetical protein
MMMTAPPTAPDAMASPPLHRGPAYREQEYGKGKRNRDTGDIQDIAKGVILHRRLECLRLLNQRDEHDSSSVSVGQGALGNKSRQFSHRADEGVALMDCDLAH